MLYLGGGTDEQERGNAGVRLIDMLISCPSRGGDPPAFDVTVASPEARHGCTKPAGAIKVGMDRPAHASGFSCEYLS